MPRRNWAAICQIQDNRFRTDVSLATDPYVLDGFVRGFPELFFTDKEDEGPLRVPLSALMEAAYEFSSAEYPDEPEHWEVDRHFGLIFAGNIGAHLDIPIAHSFGEEYDDVPPSISEGLKGQSAQAGMTVRYLGELYIVTDITFAEGYPKIGETFKEVPAVDRVKLALAEFVALDK